MNTSGRRRTEIPKILRHVSWEIVKKLFREIRNFTGSRHFWIVLLARSASFRKRSRRHKNGGAPCRAVPSELGPNLNKTKEAEIMTQWWNKAKLEPSYISKFRKERDHPEVRNRSNHGMGYQIPNPRRNQHQNDQIHTKEAKIPMWMEHRTRAKCPKTFGFMESRKKRELDQYTKTLLVRVLQLLGIQNLE